MGKTSVIWTEDKLINKDKCFECGLDGELHYHHVVPETLGGTKTIPLCLICHGKIHNKKFVNYRELQRAGIERAKLEGKFMGRKPDTVESPEKFLNKSKNKKILELFKQRKSYSSISEIIGCSKTTITKVVRVYEDHYKILLPKSLKDKKESTDISIPDWMKLM
jgi:hypothetical protein